MGLIKAALGATGGVLADQWKEFFYCDALPADVLVRIGQKRIGKRSSNTKGEANIISNGSKIAVADGQCMIIVEQGKVVEVCAEPGEFTYDASSEPSLFTGDLGENIKETFKNIGKRFTFGGDPGKDQRIYYFNTKEIIGNMFGTPSPIMFRVKNSEVNLSRTVQVKCNGMYSYQITDPILFYTKYCGNVAYEYTREEIDPTLKIDFIDALQPVLGEMSNLGIRPDELPAKAGEFKAAMNRALQTEWIETRGISIVKIALNPITLTAEDMKKINELEEAASYGSNPFLMAGRMTAATANAMEGAAANGAGAVSGFMGMGMAGSAMGGGFNAAQQFYNTGVQQMQQQQATPVKDGWQCVCGSVNKGKFCPECGAKKPAGAPLYRCDKCGWEPEDPYNPPKFCPECGDRFDDNDVR